MLGNRGQLALLWRCNAATLGRDLIFETRLLHVCLLALREVFEVYFCCRRYAELQG